MISLTWRSRILLTVGRIEIGLYPDTESFRAADFGTGTTLATFHSDGSNPSAREVLNKFARLGAMLCAVDLSINDDISSGPDDLEVSSRASISATYSEEHFRLSGKHDGSSMLWSIGGFGTRGGQLRLKQE